MNFFSKTSLYFLRFSQEHDIIRTSKELKPYYKKTSRQWTLPTKTLHVLYLLNFKPTKRLDITQSHIQGADDKLGQTLRTQLKQ
jgi:hypothetical protein